jgi:hypothetical protein
MPNGTYPNPQLDPYSNRPTKPPGAWRPDAHPVAARRPVRWAQRAQIRDRAADLLAFALRLGDKRPVDVRGAAMTARLLSDKASTLNQDDGHNLRSALRAARLALDATDPTAEDLPAAA